MEHRELGRTGYRISEVGFGAWAIGGTWGKVNDEDSMAALRRALELGVDFFDTADVYGDGHSERLLGRLRRETKAPMVIATKAGRRVPKHTADSYTKQTLTSAVERSLENLGVDALDLLQLHAPPTDVYYRPEVFGALDDLVKDGKIRFYGVSVEKVEEGLKALEYPGVQSVQIIFNLFRQRPAELFFAEARRRKVGVLARLPLSSGMLTGKMTKATAFEADDHRKFNRNGEAFDRGETFSGVDYELALSVVEDLKPLVPPGLTLSELALRYILDFPAVSSVIPGARNVRQVEQNVRPAALPPLGAELHDRLARLYRARLAEHVHQRW
jgi:aryl-alcohol dehydrogenase-like predicted oxidoreductase